MTIQDAAVTLFSVSIMHTLDQYSEVEMTKAE